LTASSLRKAAALRKVAALRKAATLRAVAQRTLFSREKSTKTKEATPKKPTPTFIVKSPVPIKNCMLRLVNVETWNCIVKRSFRVKKPVSCADKAKGKIKAL
ncbi:hypothetical protein Tco_0665089, partial [Tanacetum coccineum]